MSSQRHRTPVVSPRKPRRRIIQIDLEDSSSDDQVVDRYPRVQSKGPRELAKAAATIPTLIQKMPTSQKRQQTERDERPGSKTLRNQICPTATLPAFLPQIDPHKNWSYSRVFSQEIYEVMEKHLRKFDGNYLSRSLFGEIFFERINDPDAEFDQSVFFQAVLVEEIGQLFKYGQQGQRIRIKCSQASTCNSSATSSMEKELTVVALDSLAELLNVVVKPGDYLVLFGDILIEKERVICINSRQRHPVCIAHYRHNGIFKSSTLEGPILLRNSLKNSIVKFCLSMHELGPNEFRFEVEANSCKELVLRPDTSDQRIQQRLPSTKSTNNQQSRSRLKGVGLTGSKSAEMVRSCSRSPPPTPPHLTPTTSPLKSNGPSRSRSKSKELETGPAKTVKPRRVLSPVKLIEQVRLMRSKVPSTAPSRSRSKSKELETGPTKTVKPRRGLSPVKLIEQVRQMRSKVPSTAPISNLKISSPKASTRGDGSNASKLNSQRSERSTKTFGRNRSPTVSLVSQVSRRESSPEMFLDSSSSSSEKEKPLKMNKRKMPSPSTSSSSDTESRLSLDIEKEIDAGVLDSRNDSPKNVLPGAKRPTQKTIFQLKDCYVSLNPIPGLSSSRTSPKNPPNKKKRRK